MKAFLQTRVSVTGLLHATGLLAGLGTIAGFLGNQSWLLELTTHFRLQYAVALLGLAVAVVSLPRPASTAQQAWLRHRGPALVYAALALVNLAVLAPYLAPGPPAAPATTIPFRVVTLNVHTANTRHDLVTSFLYAASPDVIVLSEVDDRWLTQLASLTNTWPHTLAAPRDDNFGIALFSRWPLTDARVACFGEAELPTIEAEISLHGRSVHLVGTHPLPPSNAENAARRDEQLTAIARQLATRTGPRLLLGDLNATPWSPVFRRLLQQSGLVDTLPGRGYQPTWPADFFLFWIPLDHCLISPDLTVRDRRVGPRVGSDHLPLIVELALPASK